MVLDPDERAVALGRYMVETGATVRQAAAIYGVSKSTVHKDVCKRLFFVNPELHALVKGVLAYHLSVRHLRGGSATAERYKNMRVENCVEKARKI